MIRFANLHNSLTLDIINKMERVLKKVSLKEADKLDIEFWKSKTPEERLDILQYLREIYYEFKNEDRKRFQKVYRVIKQK